MGSLDTRNGSTASLWVYRLRGSHTCSLAISNGSQQFSSNYHAHECFARHRSVCRDPCPAKGSFEMPIQYKLFAAYYILRLSKAIHLAQKWMDNNSIAFLQWAVVLHL